MSELHQAAAAGDFDKVEEILLQNKCDPNQRDEDWSFKTPLHWAAATGNFTQVEKPETFLSTPDTPDTPAGFPQSDAVIQKSCFTASHAEKH